MTHFAQIACMIMNATTYGADAITISEFNNETTFISSSSTGLDASNGIVTFAAPLRQILKDLLSACELEGWNVQCILGCFLATRNGDVALSA